MSIGTNLFRLRAEVGLSQDALAEMMGVSRQSVSKWETDGSVPELDKLVKLADIFGVSLDELILDKRPEAPAGTPQTPPQAPPVTVPPTHRTVGAVLLGAGIVGWVLLLALAGLSGLLAGLIFFAPLIVCGVICLTVRRRAGLWCAWALFLAGSAAVGSLSGVVSPFAFLYMSVRNPDLFADGSWNLHLLFSVGMTALYILLVAATCRSFRDLRLPRTGKGFLILALLWAAALLIPAALDAAGDSIITSLTELDHAGRDGMMTIARILSTSASMTASAATAAAVTATVGMIRKR